jgi:hypothetical protein
MGRCVMSSSFWLLVAVAVDLRCPVLAVVVVQVG